MSWTTATTRATDFFVTAAIWNAEHVDNMNFLKEVNYNEFAAPVSVTATTEGTANSVVATSPASINYEAVPHMIEFSCRGIQPDNGAAARSITIVVYDSTTALAQIAVAVTPAAATMIVPCHRVFRLTPTAAAHSYNIKAFVSAGTGTVQAGAGGAGNHSPGYIRVYRVPT